MPDRAVYLTREGFKRLDDELEHLRTVKLPEVSERIRRSKDMTNVDDNAEYDEAKSEQGFVEGRIAELEGTLANAQIIGELSHYRLRLNRGGLRSGVIFLRSERDEALRAMETFKGRVKWWIDADGGLAKLLGVKTLPALMLIDADGNVKFAAPLLNDELVKQLAKNYNKPETVFRAPRPVASPRVGIPPAKGGVGRYSIR